MQSMGVGHFDLPLSGSAGGFEMPLASGSRRPSSSSLDAAMDAKIVCPPEACQYRPGDWVILGGQDRQVVGQVIKLEKHTGAHRLQICQYLRPEDTTHPPSCAFWPNEIFKTRDISHHRCTDVISRCFVLHISQYLCGRPRGHLWAPNTPLYLCEKRYSLENPLEPFQPIQRWKDIPQPEMQYFERPMRLEKLPSPFLRGISGKGRLLNDYEVTSHLTQGHSIPQHFEVPSMDDHKRYAPLTQFDEFSVPPAGSGRRQKRQRTESAPHYSHSMSTALDANEAFARALSYDARAGEVSNYDLIDRPRTSKSARQMPIEMARTLPPMDPSNEYVGLPEKPPYSYASLIAQAIWNKPDRRCRLEEIYEFVSSAYPWYQTTKTSWQNMLRHNLSLRPCFVKVARTSGVGKGNWWTLDLDKEPGGFDGLTFGSRRVVAAGNRQLAAEAVSTQKKEKRREAKERRATEDAMAAAAAAASLAVDVSTGPLGIEGDAIVPEMPMQELSQNTVYPVPHQPLGHQPAPRPLPGFIPAIPLPNGQQLSPTQSSGSEHNDTSSSRRMSSLSPFGSFSSGTSNETHAAALVAASKNGIDFFSQLGHPPFVNPQRSSQTTSHEREPMATSESGVAEDAREGNLDLMASVCQLVSHNGTGPEVQA